MFVFTDTDTETDISIPCPDGPTHGAIDVVSSCSLSPAGWRIFLLTDVWPSFDSWEMYIMYVFLEVLDDVNMCVVPDVDVLA